MKSHELWIKIELNAIYFLKSNFLKITSSTTGQQNLKLINYSTAGC